jgi:hypothetical protein
LSCLEIISTPAQLTEEKKLVVLAEVIDDEEEDAAYFMDQEFFGLYDEDVWECLECFLNLPESEHPENNPLSYSYIHEKQQEDNTLLALQAKFPNNYVNMELDDEGKDIVCYKKHPDRDDWKLALPDSMVYQKLYNGFTMRTRTSWSKQNERYAASQASQS